MAFQIQRRTKSKTKVCQLSLLETIEQEPAEPKGNFEQKFGLRTDCVALRNSDKLKNTHPFLNVDTAEFALGKVVAMPAEFNRLLEAAQRDKRDIPQYFLDKKSLAWYNGNIIGAVLHFLKRELDARSFIVMDSIELSLYFKGGGPTVYEVDDSDDTESDSVEFLGKEQNPRTEKDSLEKVARSITKKIERNGSVPTDVLVPFNVRDNHWVLCHIRRSNAQVKLSVYDSMNGAPQSFQPYLKKISYLVKALGSHWKHASKSVQELEKELVPTFVRYETPQQDDQACGVFVCFAGAMLMAGLSSEEIRNLHTTPTLIRKCRVFFLKLLATRQRPFPFPFPLLYAGTRKKSKARLYANTNTNTNRKRSVHRRFRLRRLP